MSPGATYNLLPVCCDGNDTRPIVELYRRQFLSKPARYQNMISLQLLFFQSFVGYSLANIRLNAWFHIDGQRPIHLDNESRFYCQDYFFTPELPLIPSRQKLL